MPTPQHVRLLSKKRTSTNVDSLTYSPKKHKDKKKREMRQKLQEKILPTPKPPDITPPLKYRAFTVTGLDVEAGWAVSQLLTTRNFDVS